MYRRLPRSRLDERLLAEALALAMHPAANDKATAAQTLSRLADGNRTAIERAVARLTAKVHEGPSEVARRALDLLRQVLREVHRQQPR